MSREKLLSSFEELECNFKTLSEKRVERITKMQNFSQNELEKIIKLLNLSQTDLEDIAKIRRIKSYKNMSKEDLLIVVLK